MTPVDYLVILAAVLGMAAFGIGFWYYDFNLDDFLFEKEDK